MQTPPQTQVYRYRVTRLLMNGAEPDNVLHLYGSASAGEAIPLDTLAFDGEFRDGPMRCSISPRLGGGFDWNIGGRAGTAHTFEEAWLEMPAFLTDPDHYELLVKRLGPLAIQPSSQA